MAAKFLDLMLTESVHRAQQESYGRRLHGPRAPSHDSLTREETAFMADRDGFYLATVNLDGWPYVQHRGGPQRFLRVLSKRTLACADNRGNRQLLSTGHILGNQRVALFLMDYPNRGRPKSLGRARLPSARGNRGLRVGSRPARSRDRSSGSSSLR